MKRLLFPILLYLILPAAALAQVTGEDVDRILADATNPTSDYYYSRLRMRLEKDDPLLLPSELMRVYLGFASQPTYQPTEEPERIAIQAYNARQYAKAVELGRAVLSRNPVNLTAMLIVSLSYQELQNKQEADRYGDRYVKLMKAIFGTGTGRSKDFAIHAISTADVTRIVTEMQLEIMARKQLTEEDNTYEVVQVRPRGATSPNTFDLFFNVTLVTASPLAEMLDKMADEDDTQATTSKPKQEEKQTPRSKRTRKSD